MKKTVTLILLILCKGALSSAQINALNWKESLALVRQNNPELQSAEATLRAAEERERAAFSSFYPSLSGNASYSQSQTSTSTTGVTDTVTSNSATAGLSLSQNLFAGFKDITKVQTAKAQLISSQANLRLVKARISNEFKTAYEDFFYSSELVKLTSSIVRRRQENLRLVEMRFQSGRENKGAFLLSRANSSQAGLDDLQARNQKDLSQQELLRFLGSDGDPFSSLTISDQIPVSEPPSQVDFRGLVIKTPQYQQAEQNEIVARSDLSTARADFYPSLDLSASTGKFGSEFSPKNDRWTLGVTLTVPLFNGGRDYFETQAAKQQLLVATLAKTNLFRETLVSLKRAYFNFVEATERLKVAGQFKEAATVRAEIARSQYGNGLIKFQDWDQIESDLIQREKSYLQAQRDRVLSEAAWEQVRGEGVIP